MSLNTVLIWFVGAVGVTSLVRLLRSRRTRYPGWLGVLAVLLGTLGVGLLLFPDVAGLVAGALALPLLVLPILGQRWAQRLVGQRRYAAARRVSRAIAVLHPFDGWREGSVVLDALELADSGRRDEAAALLAAAEHRRPAASSPSGRLARVQLHQIQQSWDEAVRWIEEEVDPRDLARELPLIAGYLRALGETGHVERMLAAYRALVHDRTDLGGTNRAALQLFATAFAGQRATAVALCEGRLASWAPETRRYWIATAELAAGRTDAARATLEEMARSTNEALRRAARRRLEWTGPQGAPHELSLAARETLDSIVVEIEHAATVGTIDAPPRGRAPATLGLLALLSVVFLLELPGGSTDAENLHALGALLTSGPLEPWRWVAAGLLHFGAVHLAANLLGLWLLGRYVERLYGTRRFLVGYAVSGVASFALLDALARLRDAPPMLALGASGAVMGLVGMTLAAAWHGWRRHRTAVARRGLTPVLLILVLQASFDLAVPQVSSLAHATGALVGLAIGFPLLPRREERDAPRWP